MSKINIVLYEPEIPQNTGNVMRTCVATGAKLHLIEPMGFKIDESRLKRSAVDYYDLIEYQVYQSWEEFIHENTGQYYFLTRYARKSYHEIEVATNEKTYLIFGRESTGIKKEILQKNLESCFRIPTTKLVRSLNLSNAVAIVLYDSLRKLDFPNLSKTEPSEHKGPDFLLK